MNKFKVGDKVKFLNRTGGGIIPTLTNEIILDYVDDKAGQMFTSEYSDKKNNTNFHNDFISEGSTNNDVEKVYLSRKGQQIEKGVYLVFIPKDQVWILTQGFEVYLVNNTDYSVLYSLFLEQEDGMFKGEDFGSLEAKEKIHLDSIAPADTEKWSEGCLQILFHKDLDDKVFVPVSYNLKIRNGKFYKEGCFEQSDLVDAKALVIPITLIEKQSVFVEKDEQKKILQKIKIEKQDIKPIEKPKQVSFFDKYITKKGEAEIDLHIEELTDEESKMQPFEKLNTQMEYFKKCLNEAKRILSKNLTNILLYITSLPPCKNTEWVQLRFG